jgi:hypothetical protein
VHDLLGGVGDGEAFVDAVADDPGDLVSDADEWYSIAVAGSEFGVDEDVLELLLAAEAKGTEAIAGAPAPDSEGGAGLVGVEVGLEAISCGGACRRPLERDLDVPYTDGREAGDGEWNFGDSVGPGERAVAESQGG